MAGVEHLLKGAFLIGSANPQRTFLCTLDLEYLRQRFAPFAQAPVRLVIFLAVPGETRISKAPGFIRIVRYGQEVAILKACGFKPLPEFYSVGYIQA